MEENKVEIKPIEVTEDPVMPKAFQSLPIGGVKKEKDLSKKELVKKAQNALGGFDQQIKMQGSLIKSLADGFKNFESDVNRNFIEYDIISLAIRNVLIAKCGLTTEDWEKEVLKSQTEIRKHQEAAYDIRNNFATVDREAKEGDFVAVNFEGRINDTPFDGGSGNFQLIEIGKKRFLPEIEDSLIGKKKSDVYDVAVKFPDNYFKKELAGKESVFSVVVLAVKEKKQSVIQPPTIEQVTPQDNVIPDVPVAPAESESAKD